MTRSTMTISTMNVRDMRSSFQLVCEQCVPVDCSPNGVNGGSMALPLGLLGSMWKMFHVLWSWKPAEAFVTWFDYLLLQNATRSASMG